MPTIRRQAGRLTVEARPSPLTLIVSDERGRQVQHIVFENDGTLSFSLDDAPVLGMGEGGPRPEKGRPWREQPVQFDRRGAFDTMEPRWQSDMYGSRNPAAMLLGTHAQGGQMGSGLISRNTLRESRICDRSPADYGFVIVDGRRAKSVPTPFHVAFVILRRASSHLHTAPCPSRR
ncbi:MAG: hypothetical protein ACM3NQ_15230, partial [Bacteroidales bacterium]